MTFENRKHAVSQDVIPSGKAYPQNRVFGPNLDSHELSVNSAVALLEAENAGLRQIVIELLEKNQKLRDRMNTAGM